MNSIVCVYQPVYSTPSLTSLSFTTGWISCATMMYQTEVLQHFSPIAIPHPQLASSPIFLPLIKFTSCAINILPATIHFPVEFVVFEEYSSLLI